MDLKAILGDAYTAQIEKAINDAVGHDFVSRADYNARNEELKAQKAMLTERDTQLEKLKSQAAGSEALQAEIKKLQEANDLANKEYSARLVQQERDFALKTELKDKYKAHDALSVIPHLKQDAIKFENGTFNGLEEQMKALTESKSFLFNAEGVKGGTGGAPANPLTGGIPTGEVKKPKYL